MKKSLLFLLTLLSATILFWGCDDETTVTNTEYVSVNISDIMDTIGLDIYDFVKKDTILDTTKGDTSFSTNTQVLEYGTVLYSAGTFNCYIQKVSVDRRHIRKALVLRDLTIFDTVSSNNDPDTVINSTDTLFLDSVSSYDSTKSADLGTSSFSDTALGYVNDTIITSNNSYLMTVNGNSAGYVGLGYLMYGGAADVSISGIKSVESSSIILNNSTDILILSSDNLQKISKSIVNNNVVNVDTLILPVSSSSSKMKIKGDTLYFAGNGINSLNIIDISTGNLNYIDTVSIMSGSGSITDLALIGSTVLLNTKSDASNDVLKAVDSGVVSFVNLYQKGTNQVISSFNDSLLLVLSPKQDSIQHGVLEIKDLSTSLNTTVGIITSARFVPKDISNLRFSSLGQGYVLDAGNNILYQINFSAQDYGTTADFLTEVASEVTSYTFDNNKLFVSKTDGTLVVYNHSNIETPVKEATISGGAATSLSILN